MTKLIKINFLTLLIHTIVIIFLMIFLTLFIAISPFFKTIGEIGAKILAGLLFTLLYMAYFWATTKFIKGPFTWYQVIFSSSFIVILGLILWGAAMETVQYNVKASFEDHQYIWIPYNIYHGLFWPITYGERTSFFKLIMCFANGIFPPLSMTLKLKSNKKPI